MEKNVRRSYMGGFFPYALASFLVGLIGGFTTLLGTSFVKDLGLPYNNTTWTTLAMSVSSAAFAPVLGKLGDIIGRWRTLLSGITIFTLGNALSAMADSLPFMLAARFTAGLGTAAIAPTVLSYIVTEFPAEALARGFSLYMLISSSAVIFGPSIGGMILNLSSWRVMMWICTVISATALLTCLLFRDRNEKSRKSDDPLKGFDFAGSVMIFIFFSLLLCIPSFGQNFGWDSAAFLTVLATAAVSLAGLVTAERRAEHPILQRSFITRKSFLLCVAALFLTQGLMQANMTNTIVFVHHTHPDNTIISSYAISIMYLGMSLGSVLLGPLADRFEPKRVLTGSLILTAVSCGLMFLYSAATPPALIALVLGILGFSLGGNAAIFMKVVLSGLPAEDAGADTGTWGLFRDLAAPFGVTVFVPLFTNRIERLIASGTNHAAASVSSIHILSLAELTCIIAGIIVVQMLPKIHESKNTVKYEAAKMTEQ